MGAPLARVPMIETAFDLLKLLDDRIDIQDIGRVLRSPWLRGGISERNSRALLEKCLRDKYPRQLKLAEVRYRAGEIKKYDRQRREIPENQCEPQIWNSPKLSTVLNALMQFEKNNKGIPPGIGLGRMRSINCLPAWAGRWQPNRNTKSSSAEARANEHDRELASTSSLAGCVA